MKKIFLYLLNVFSILILFILLYLVFFYRSYEREDAWYNDNQYIGHALFGIDGLTYVNSIEALENGYNNNIRVMEVDLLYTSDKKIVVNHDWKDNNVLTYFEFMDNLIYDKYSPMNLEMLIDSMIRYDDLYIVIDTKENYYTGDEYINIYSELIDYCKEIDISLLDRIIIQIYDYDMYYKIEDMYSFENYIFSIYKSSEINILKLVSFCVYNEIDVVGIPEWLIEDGTIKKYYIKFIKSKNLKVYVHTVNDIDKYREYIDIGIDGIYTDFLY